MALPSNVNFGYAKGTFMDDSGALASGTITFTAQARKILDPDASTPVTIVPRPQTAQLTTGSILKQLIATDDPDLEPGFTYKVEFNLTAGGQPLPIDPFYILVPTGTSGQAVDLADPDVSVDPATAIPIEVDIDVLAQGQAYIDAAIAAHLAATDPHPQYAIFIDGSGHVIGSSRINVVNAGQAFDPATIPDNTLTIRGDL